MYNRWKAPEDAFFSGKSSSNQPLKLSANSSVPVLRRCGRLSSFRCELRSLILQSNFLCPTLAFLLLLRRGRKMLIALELCHRSPPSPLWTRMSILTGWYLIGSLRIIREREMSILFYKKYYCQFSEFVFSSLGYMLRELRFYRELLHTHPFLSSEVSILQICSDPDFWWSKEEKIYCSPQGWDKIIFWVIYKEWRKSRYYLLRWWHSIYP